MNQKEKLQEATIKALTGRLTENTSSKVMLYPSEEYSDNMKHLDITNLKGILFGYYDDENLYCDATGFNTIEEMEKAVKNKEYMIPAFKEWIEAEFSSSEDWWDEMIELITSSAYGSGSSMFLIDANNNYKILYCGSDKPIITNEINSPIKDSLQNIIDTTYQALELYEKPDSYSHTPRYQGSTIFKSSVGNMLEIIKGDFDRYTNIYAIKIGSAYRDLDEVNKLMSNCITKMKRINNGFYNPESKIYIIREWGTNFNVIGFGY